MKSVQDQGSEDQRRIGPEYLGQVLEAVPEAASLHSKDATVIYANKPLQTLYGKTFEDLVGHTCVDLFHNDGPCAHEEVLSKGVSVRGDKFLEMGDRRFAVDLSPLIDSTGGINGFVRILQEETDRQRSQTELLKAERFATLGQIISGVAHDIGTPLNIISGYSEYLLMRTKQDAVGYKELSTILNQTKRVADLIRQMVELARPSQGRVEPIGLDGFLRGAVEILGHHFRKVKVSIEISSEADLPMIYGDAALLRQAFFNLLLFACRVLESEDRLEVFLSKESDSPDFVSVSMAGVDREGKGKDLAQLFKALLTTQEGEDGEALGLSLAKNVFEESGAQMASIDLGERGKTFIINIPRNGAVGVRSGQGK